MTDAFIDYFRCPADIAGFDASPPAGSGAGYFRFGDAVGYGRLEAWRPAQAPSGPVVSKAGRSTLPFDLTEVVTNLRQERYPLPSGGMLEHFVGGNMAHALYYAIRPALPVAVRRHLQKMRFSGWRHIAFPSWPVDASVDCLMLEAAEVALEAHGVDRIPFIWFWPDGAESCTMMTHDVEGAAGAAFCSELMDIDETFGIKAAFQLVPEMNGSTELARTIRDRGFEVNVHDLNHDGHLFQDREEFLSRVADINRHARRFGARGFRAGSMYRRQDWYDAFEFSYDMSVPSVAHLEPQRGGCCTVMPYFVGDVLELPLTTTQDYTLFHILGMYSTQLWREQIDRIVQLHGLVSFIAHPDYLIGMRERRVYCELLEHLAALRSAGRTWPALPGEVNDWWRQRRQMRLVPVDGAWSIEGPGAERARLAFLRMVDGRLTVERASNRVPVS